MPMVVTHQQRKWEGPLQLFCALREYWSSIMRAHPEEQQRLKEWIGKTQVPNDHLQVTSQEVTALLQAMKGMRTSAAGGLDNWPVITLSTLHQSSARSLILVFKASEKAALWPDELHYVRTQLIPKPDTLMGEARPEDLRPIAVISVWIRLWSRWRLCMQHADAHKVHSALCGGIPGRSFAPAMLDTLLSLENHFAGGLEKPPDWFALTLDASKCFDRILPTHALSLADRWGVESGVLRGLGGFLMQVRRRFSCGGYPDQIDLCPLNGLLQGDPLSVLLCNYCVDDWVRTIEAEQPPDTHLKICAFIDDRTILGDDLEQMLLAWEASKGWERQNGWECNEKKTGILALEFRLEPTPGRCYVSLGFRDIGLTPTCMPLSPTL